MRHAVTVRPGTIDVCDARMPVPRPGEVIVAVQAVGICGSDVNLFTGKHPYGSYPLVQGHEIAGTVVDASCAETAVPPDTVVVDPLVPCGGCYACRAGRDNACVDLKVIGVHTPGGFAGYVAVPARRVHSARSLPPDIAVMCEPMAVALHAVNRADPGPGAAVLVLGAGAIGRSVMLACVDRGARVLAVDRNPSRLRLARTAGAERTVVAHDEDVEAAAAQFAGGRGIGVVFEATGSPAAVGRAADLVAPTGTVVVLGVSDAELHLPMSILTRKELQVLGSRNSAGELPYAVELVERHRAEVAAMITHRFTLEQVADAFDLLTTRPEGLGKVVIQPHPPTARRDRSGLA